MNISYQFVVYIQGHKEELTSSCGQEDRVSLASYNELEQLHMQVLLNCHLVSFLYSLLKFYKSGQMTI